MHIRFARHFDGLQPHVPESAVGVATLGPAGLLGLLETQLGLPSPVPQPGAVALTYLECLLEASSPASFYCRSLQVDPVNVARTLVVWRERWYEAGWDGSFHDGVPQRLAEMAVVERVARGRVPLSQGERLQRVADELGNRQTQIDRVELHTPLDEFPYTWQQVLDALPCGLAPGVHPSPSALAGSDLMLVQERLAAIGRGDERRVAGRGALRGDGSLVIVRAASPDLSAEAVAELLRAGDNNAETLLVAERDGVILDNALERAGLPRCGFRYFTRYRAATQVLKLGLSLIWAPIDPHRMLQFLLHPTGLLPRWVRMRLADAVADSPGIGGPAWTEAIAAIERTQRERDPADDAGYARLREEIEYWLETERHDPQAGAPLEILIARTQRVSTWASTLLNSIQDAAERALFGAAHAQAEALITGLSRRRDSGVERIARLELERLVDEVAIDTPDPSMFGEARHARATTSPAAVSTPWSTVVWWNLAPPSAAVSYPWSRRELTALRAAGVRLPEVDEVLRQRSQHWLKPILHATRRLVLVAHDDERGRHPILAQVENLFDGVETVQVEHALLTGATALASIAVPTRALPLRALPTPRRWWTLSSEYAIARRDVESYSSLSKLCDYPHEWVLKYAARLEAGRATDVSDHTRLYGSLGHRLIETFFRAHDDWRSLPDDAVRAWTRTTFPGIVEREGAVLLEPGRGVDRQRVSMIIERALLRLLAHLRSAGIAEVVPEASGEVEFRGRRLTGAIDLLLTDRDGLRAVVDVKWSSEGWRRELLRENRAVQLATYAYLQKRLDASDRWPPYAFFILSSGNLLAPDAARFPDAIVSPPESDEGVVKLWQRIGVTYAWRWAQLETGRIEVVSSLTEPDDESVPPDAGLAPVNDSNPFDDYLRLTGWDAFR